MVSSITVANQFIHLAKQDGRYLTPMQILKLVYIAHGWSYGFFDEPLIDDTIEAWKYGPVIPALYQAIKKYGNKEITSAIDFPLLQRFTQETLNNEQQKVVNFVYKKYGKLSGIELSMLTHQDNTPWSVVFNPYSWGGRISDSTIHTHYKELYRQLMKDYEQQQTSHSTSVY